MCEICRKIPCDPRCPNAEQPKPVCQCDVCGGDLYVGDEYYEDARDGAKICRDCVINLDVDEVLEMCGVEAKKMEEPEEERW